MKPPCSIGVAFVLEVLYVGLHHNQETRIEKIRVPSGRTLLFAGGTAKTFFNQICVLLLKGRIHHRVRSKNRTGRGCRQKSEWT